ncbi:hypothetical protein Trydic_g22515 [Trypoxylus dichotomus]
MFQKSSICGKFFSTTMFQRKVLRKRVVCLWLFMVTMLYRSQIVGIDSNNTKVALEELPAALNVDQSTVRRRLHALEMVQKAGNWVPPELKEKDIEKGLIKREMFNDKKDGVLCI